MPLTLKEKKKKEEEIMSGKGQTLNRKDAADLAKSRAKKAGLPEPQIEDFGRINATETPKEIKTSQEIKNKELLGELEVQQTEEAAALREKYLNANPSEQEQIQKENPLVSFVAKRATKGFEKNPPQSKGEAILRMGGNLGQDINVASAAGAGAIVGVPAAIPAIASFKGVTIATAILSAGGFSLNSIRKLITSGRVNDIKGDITDLAASSKTIAMDVKNGYDPQDALRTIEAIESNIINKEGDLHLAMMSDIEGRLKGENAEEFMFRQLSLVQSKKFAIEKYMIDHDVNALNAVLGTDNNEDIING